jgi:hypothetical protein
VTVPCSRQARLVRLHNVNHHPASIGVSPPTKEAAMDSKTTVLVAGATGYIGRNIAWALHESAPCSGSRS